MGSQISDKEELTVLVTGFGPFREDYPVNPSWEIASRLPSYLPPRRAKDPNSRHGDVSIPEVRILVHPGAVRVNYEVVRGMVPSLWDEKHQGRKVDIVLHVGMASPRHHYMIERKGHRTGYRTKDVDGKYLEDEEAGKHGPDWTWYGLPDVIETDLDVPNILERWVDHSPTGVDLQLSDDAGNYLCDFIYYSSLAHLYKQQRPRKVLFLHVPADPQPQLIEQGRDLAVNLIRSIVESEVAAALKKNQASGDVETGSTEPAA